MKVGLRINPNVTKFSDFFVLFVSFVVIPPLAAITRAGSYRSRLHVATATPAT